MIEEEKSRKKKVALTVVGIITLIAFVIGASFAYYNITTNNNGSATNVVGDTEGLGVAAIYNPTPKLHLKLTTADMSLSNAGKVYYATNDKNKNYDSEETKRSIAVAGVTGGEENTKFQCESVLEIELTGTMKDALQTGDGFIRLSPTDNLEMDETDLDLAELAGKSPIEIPITYKLSGIIEGDIKATMAINNTTGDQSGLTGKELSVNITNKTFKCETVQEFSDGPIINKFYINDENTENKVTEEEKITLNLKWNSSRVTDYCILEDTNNSDNCTWKPVNGVKEISEEYTFTTPVVKTFYAYLRNSKGISIPKVASIEYKEPDFGPTKVVEDELETRYHGTNPPNYICFGTTNKTECTSTSGQDKYMYRIIGVTKDKGQGKMFKLIKKEALNTLYYWHNIGTSDIKWNASDLYKGLNGISGGKYSNLFIGNTTYMPSGWADKIETVNWKYGDFTNQKQEPATILQTEQGFTTTVSAKIGLMYVADYYFALSKTGTNCASSGSTCKTSWMYISNNDSNPPHSYEYTMLRYGFNGSRSYAWFVDSNGSVSVGYDLPYTYSVRPVFYLKSNIEITGTGTQSDPYMIIT